MRPGSDLTNQQIVDLILKQHEVWWQWALLAPIGTRRITIPRGILPQGLFYNEKNSSHRAGCLLSIAYDPKHEGH